MRENSNSRVTLQSGRRLGPSMDTSRLLWSVALGLLVSWTQPVESDRILVFFCQTARSHHIVFHPVIRELALRGHQVDYYTHFPLPDPPENLNQFLIETVDSSMEKMEDLDMIALGRAPVVLSVHFMRTYRFEELPCEKLPLVQELFASNKTYDLVIGEFFFYQEDFAVLIHKFKALGAAFSSLPDVNWLNEMAGLPDNPAYMVHFFSGFSDTLSFMERVSNTLTTLGTKLLDYYYVSTTYQAHADQHYRYEGWESRPSIKELSSDLALILSNSHHSLGYPYPKAPHVKEIMGTNVEENPKPLSKDLQEYMDSAEHGVVYFSMGSMLSVAELKKVGAYDVLVRVFKNLKQKVLWKWTTWSGEEIPDLPNVKMAKWLPQQSILAHNNTKLFITHGGLGGMTEAISSGVPLVCLPVFGDQFKNAKMMTAAGFGVELSFANLSHAVVDWAVNEVLNNPRYRDEAFRRSELFKDRPMKPVQEAVYWIEYVLKHGKVLQPAGARLSFYQLYLLDVIGSFVVALVLTYIIAKKTIVLLISLLRRGTFLSQNSKKNR